MSQSRIRKKGDAVSINQVSLKDRRNSWEHFCVGNHHANEFVSSNALPLAIQALQAQPILSLIFMPYGIVLRSDTALGKVEKLVSPEGVAQMLSGLSNPSWSTGLLSPSSLWMGDSNGKRIICEYRKPEMTGIWLEGSDTPLRVMLPGLLMLREVKPDGGSSYQVWAVKRRPRDLKAKLYNAPLPNVGGNGVCWGTVAVEKRDPVSLESDWTVFLGSRFGDHSCGGKSKAHNRDIRQQLIALDSSQERYPHNDLTDSRQTLEGIIKGMMK